MPDTYTTDQGEAWDEVAKVVYGDESRLDALLEANPSEQGSLTLDANTTLTVPDLPTTESVPTAPWDRE